MAAKTVNAVEFDNLHSVYMAVVRNWAVEIDDLRQILPDMGDSILQDSLKKLTRTGGLLSAEHINGEKPLTYQSMFDIENQDDAEENAEAAFAAAFTKGSDKAPKATGKTGATGPRYSESQIKAGLKARAEGKSNAEVAKAAGVKSPSYFAKVLKDREVRGVGRVATETRRVRAAEKAREARAASTKKAAAKPAAKKATTGEDAGLKTLSDMLNAPFKKGGRSK